MLPAPAGIEGPALTPCAGSFAYPLSMDSLHVELEMRGLLDMLAAFLPNAAEADAVRHASPKLALCIAELAEASNAKSVRELLAKLQERDVKFATLAELREEYDDDV